MHPRLSSTILDALTFALTLLDALDALDIAWIDDASNTCSLDVFLDTLLTSSRRGLHPTSILHAFTAVYFA